MNLGGHSVIGYGRSVTTQSYSYTDDPAVISHSELIVGGSCRITESSQREHPINDSLRFASSR